MNQRLLEGEVMNGDRTELERLRASVDRLTRERDALREENGELHDRLRESDAPVAELRAKLEPFYRLLQAIWGDIDRIAPQASQAEQPPAQDARTAAVWQAWKQRLGGTVAKGIDALLIHGELNTQQLSIATGLSRPTITNTVVLKLNRAGLINKNAGKFSLKAL